MDWRLIIDAEPHAGAENMAFDQALLETAQAGGGPAVRLYRWLPPCLSLGRNQPTPGPGLAAAAAERGIDVVRRPTGGGAVYHDRELTYAVVVPVGVLGSPRESYGAIHRALAAGLRRLGAPAELAPRLRPAQREAAGQGGRRGSTLDDGGWRGASVAGSAGAWDGPCFDTAAAGEVVVAGRKLVGSAQRCERRTLLQHGSILLDDDQDVVAELLGGAAGAARAGARPTSLATVLGHAPAWHALADAVVAGLETALGIALAPSGVSSAERARARVLALHFRSATWSWRR